MSDDVKVILINGCFDILHAGHIRLIERAWELDPEALLIIALNDDDYLRKKRKGGRFNLLDVRKMVMQSVRNVDLVISFSGDNCAQVIRSCKPNWVVKGDDYTPDKLNPEEAKAIEEVGATLVTVKKDDNSSSKIWKYLETQEGECDR